MSHNPERYAPEEAFNLSESVAELRAYIGELEDFRQPTRAEAETAAYELFPNLLTNECAKVIEALLESEAAAAREADKHGQ